MLNDTYANEGECFINTSTFDSLKYKTFTIEIMIIGALKLYSSNMNNGMKYIKKHKKMKNKKIL